MTASTDILVRVAQAEKRRRRHQASEARSGQRHAACPISPAAHTPSSSMQDGDRERRNPYSLMGTPGDSSCYEISVLRTADSRGGSPSFTTHVDVGNRAQHQSADRTCFPSIVARAATCSSPAVSASRRSWP